MKKIPLIVCLGIIMAAGSAAASEPVQFSLTPDIALHDKNTEIEGFSLNLWGQNPQTSAAIGIVNGFTGMSKGFTLGLLLNYSDSYTGFQLGAVNTTQGSMMGWQMGLIDYTVGSMQGMQLGFVNYAGQLKGLQLGLFNYAASTATGLQIGILNLIPQNEWFNKFPDEIAPGMLLVNWRF